ncbi:MAG: hypothetical protein ACI835_004089 [Planctomycetota bacterium]|jgi:hypothetical protein
MSQKESMSDANKRPSTRRTVVTGFFLLAVSMPMGLTLESLHALKVQVYLGSVMRREMWTLAHAHGAMLGILCLVYGSVAERWLSEGVGESTAKLVRFGAIMMPIGFFLGGVGNHEGDPGLFILLVPIGALLLLLALFRAGMDCSRGAAR